MFRCGRHNGSGGPHIAHSKPGSVIRDGDWKLLRFDEDGREELYNLKDDIGKSSYLAERMPARAAQIRAQLHTILNEMVQLTENAPLDRETD